MERPKPFGMQRQPHSTPWTLMFWIVLVGIVAVGALLGVRKNKQEKTT